ncbi:DUF5995 family protein [Haloplanus salinarum]|uniref:DUF5995 family protein n=1 Tax=Haloplanus salinarum TaxID=1912324 RepID=UPI00214A8D47|nr:DUF5995 family protein [Haloplanus salinarum]
MAGYAAMARRLDSRHLRAAVRGIRAAPPDAPDHATDPALVDRLERPFEGVDDVYTRLNDLESRLRAAGDRRAVFLTIYTRMTAAVRAAIADGRFADPAWLRRYTVTFADHYRRALLSFERGDHDVVPGPWRVAFRTAVAGSALVAQDAFLGINAHITYDLALALRDVGIDPDRATKRADHDRIDGVLARLVDAQQAALVDLYAPGLSRIDDTLGRFDEALSLFSMTEGRAWAWLVATVLTDVPAAPARAAVHRFLEATATGSAHFVRSPPVDPAVVTALRRVERDRGGGAINVLAASFDEHLA